MRRSRRSRPISRIYSRPEQPVVTREEIKMTLNRRAFIGTGAAAAALLSAPMLGAQGKPRVVVVGGGAGGATAARYIAKDSDGAIDVTLVEPSRSYFTCYFSNLYIGGFTDLEDISHT